MDAPAGPLAELVAISKTYPNGVQALRGVDLALHTGEVHAVVGENGAGKSTLVKILFGLEAPTSGEVRLRGAPVRSHTPAAAIRAGIGMVHQHFKLVASLTVAENLVLGDEPRRRRLFDRGAARRAAARAAGQLGVDLDPDARVGDLAVGDQQRLEIMKALHRGAEILILDEPTAVLTPQEADRLLDTITGLADSGRGVVLITHKLREVLAVAETITVVRDGLRVATVDRSDATADILARAMVGRDVVAPRLDEPAAIGPRRLVVDGVHTGGGGRVNVRGVDLTVRGGEIVGIAGVDGNGQDDLVDAVTGLRPVAAGTVHLDGVDITGWPPGRRRCAGLAHIAADRMHRGAAAQASLEDNLVADRVDVTYSRRGLLERRAIGEAARAAIAPLRHPHRLAGGAPVQPVRRERAEGRRRTRAGRAASCRRRRPPHAGGRPGGDGGHPRGVAGAAQRRGCRARRLRRARRAPADLRPDRGHVRRRRRRRLRRPGVGRRRGDRPGHGRSGAMTLTAPDADTTAPPMTTNRSSTWGSELIGTGSIIVGAVALGVAVIAVLSDEPGEAVTAFLTGPFDDRFQIGSMLARATPLVFTGAAIAYAFRAGVFNLGAEGQLYLGAAAGTAVAVTFDGPGGLVIVAACAAGVVAGAAWAAIPGWLLAHYGTNEIVITLMLNFVAVLFVAWLVANPLADPGRIGFPQSERISEPFQLPRLLEPSALHVGLLVGVVVCVAGHVVLTRTVPGFRLRLAGQNPEFSRYVGHSPQRSIVGAMVVSGAVAGLGGIAHILGDQLRLLPGFSPGYGFTGILIALLARNQLLAVPVAATFYAWLLSGAQVMEETTDVPREAVSVVQGVLFLFVTATAVTAVLRRRRAASGGGR